jgi:predicted TIM-barrel fold metal-dependent hydrolase
LTKELLKVRGGDGVVFASDWPHTRFEGMDIKPWVEQCLEWCGDDDVLAKKLFRDNAKVLWDVDGSVDEAE